ncbi:hypothetical protein BH09BAC6_BH09BAC6_12440 [soil metagenome]
MQTQTTEPIEIVSFPARNGDSFLIKHPDCNLLIDAGYEDTFIDFIEDYLKELHKAGQKLSRFIITHIDEDHIHGAIPLLEANGSAEEHKLIAIEQIWFNSYRHLHKGEMEFELTQAGTQLVKRLKRVNNTTDSQISARQGSSFAGLILGGKYAWNEDFDEGPIIATSEPVKLANGVLINLLSPTREKLDKLETYWKDQLKRLGFKDRFGANDLLDDAYEYLLLREKEINEVVKPSKIGHSTVSFETLFFHKQPEDRRASNGSSIAFILTIGDKRLLLLGDAHPSVILNSLKVQFADKPQIFDFIKIAHHGSYFNSNLDLLNFIDAPKYGISTDGEGHHPNVETLCWIVGRNNTFKRTLYFNYKHFGFDFLNKEEWKTKYNYDINAPEKGDPLKITI